MIPELKRSVRFPRKHFRRWLHTHRKIKNLTPVTYTELLKMYDEFKKEKIVLERKYENSQVTKTKDKEFWRVEFYLELLERILGSPQ